MSVIEVDFPANIASVATIADLRALPSLNLDAAELYVVRAKGLYSWVPDSFATDDGDKVLKPNDITPLQAGRWLFGPQGATGPADNTYTTEAALLASDPSRKAARLAPDTGGPQVAAPYNYVNGKWTRQAVEGLTSGIRSYGAVGDGTTDDSAAYAAGKAATGGTSFLVGGNFTLPRGRYALSSAQSSDQFWNLKGSGQLSSFFVNTGADTVDLFSNGGYGYVDYEDFGARNFRGVIKSTGQVESVGARNLHVYANSGYAFDVAGNFLVAKFDKVRIDGISRAGSGGIRSGGSFNNFELSSLELLNLTDNAFDLVFSEGVLTTNMRVEGGNPSGKSVFKLAQNTHQHIINVGGYIEGAHEYVVSGDGAGTLPWQGPGLLAWIGTHFTFWQANVPHKWAVTSPMPVMACDFSIPTRLPPTAQAIGYNHNMIRSEYVGHTPFVSKRRRPAYVAGTGPWVQDVIVFSRPLTNNTPKNVTVLVGRLTYAASWSNPDGGAFGSVTREYQVMVRARGGNNLEITVTPIGSPMDDGNGAGVLSFAASGAASTTAVTVIANWNGINPTTVANFDQQFSFTWNQSAGLPENTFAISEPGA